MSGRNQHFLVPTAHSFCHLATSLETSKTYADNSSVTKTYALNRPTQFTRTSEDGTVTTVTAAYDYMGRRVFKKVEENGSVTLHQRYLYRGYLQIVALDLRRTTLNDLWLITWDPTESPRGLGGGLDKPKGFAPQGRAANGVAASQSVATRPLAIQKNGTWYTYGLDLTKNVMEVYAKNGYISTVYTYTPFGEVTASGDVDQPIQWSSEVWDADLRLAYYNYRYINALNSRWLSRDLLIEYSNYFYCYNKPFLYIDVLGNIPSPSEGVGAGGYIRPPMVDNSNKNNWKKDIEITVKVVIKQEFQCADIFIGIQNMLLEIFQLRPKIPNVRTQIITDKTEFNPGSLCEKGQCISKLIIEAHAQVGAIAEIKTAGGSSLIEIQEEIPANDISNLFKNDIPFCKEATVEFISCNLGKFKPLNERINNILKNKGINANVITYPYSVLGNGQPTLPERVSQWVDEKIDSMLEETVD